MIYHLYTDGACQPNPGSGGWACILLDDQNIYTKQGYYPQSTNNRMEVNAALNGINLFLEIRKSNEDILHLYSDSTYLINGIKKWVFSWEKNNWITKGNKPVLNQDLWKEIIKLHKQIKIECYYVEAHNGNYYNELADSMAVSAIKKGNELLWSKKPNELL